MQPRNPAIAPALAWAREFLPHYFSADSCAFHAELMADLHDDENKRIARVASRGHAKSACAALAFPLWCICERKRHNIVIVTHEESLARQFVRDIRQELEANERILAAYGELCREPLESTGDAQGRAPNASAGTQRETKGARRTAPPKRRAARQKWTDGNFMTATGISVRARGTGGSFRGLRVGPNRPDLIVCDDLERDDTVRSREGRAKLECWLRRVVMPALAPHGRLLVLGTMLHFDSLLAGLADRKRWPGWNYRVYRALEAELASPATADTPAQFRMTALWPAVWPVERLEEERAVIGEIAFQQEYLANPMDEATRVFQPEWLRRTAAAEFDALDVEGRLLKLIAVDPATGKDSGDYFALWVGGVDSATGVIHSRALTLERIHFPAQVERIVAAFERYRPLLVGIESVAYQDALIQALDELSRTSRLYIPTVPLGSRKGKVARIQASACYYEKGFFRLPEELAPEAEAQFLYFPGGSHDDAPDVCAMAIELARGLHSGSAGSEALTRSNGELFPRGGAW